MFRTIMMSLPVVFALLGTAGSTGAEAAVIASGETRVGILVGGAGGNNREETWTFSGADGDRVVISTAHEGTGNGNAQPEIILSGPGIDPGSVSATGNFNVFRLTHQLAGGGDYTITVRDNANNSDGYYSIAFVNLSAGQLTSPADSDGGPLASGQSVSGSISGNADMDLYQFEQLEGSLGDRIIVIVSGSGPQPELYLFPPGGGGPVESFPGSGNLSTRRVDHRLEGDKTGTYTLLVSDYGMNNNGSYTLSLAKIPGSATSATDGDGGAIASGQTKIGYFSPAIDSDLFSFEAGAGDRVVITTAPLSGSNIQPEIYLYPPGGGELEAASLGSASGHLLDAVVAAGGTYTVLVSDYGFNGEGWYSLSFARIPGATTSAGDTDGGTIASGETKLGYLSNRSDTDIFQFEGEAGDLVILTTAENTGNVQPEIRLYAPNGSFVAQAVGGKDSQWLELRLPVAQTGTYTAIVSDFNLDAEGWYAMSLAKIPGAVTSSGDADGGTIMSGGTRAGVLTYQADTDIYLFHGTAGSTMVISASSFSSGVEPELRLYAPDGNLEQYSLPVTRATRNDWQLQQTGVYTVVLSDAGLNASGSYAFSLVQIPGGISPSNDPNDNDGGLLLHAERKAGAFHYPPDQDVYHFYGRPGDRITITAAAYASSNVQPEIYLYPPGGGALEASASGSLMPQKLMHTLLRRGIYTIVVSDNNLDSTGYYSIVFSTSASAPASGIYNAFPPNGSTVVTAETKFMWDPVAGATGYEFYYGTDPLGPLLLLGTVTANSRLFPEHIAKKPYYWRVIALTPAGRVLGPFTWFKFMTRPVIHRDDYTDGNDGGDPDWLPYRYASWRVNESKQLVSTANVENRIISNSFNNFLTGKIQALTMLSGSTSTANASLLFSYQGDHQRYRYVKLSAGKILVGQAGYLGGEAGGTKLTIPMPTVLKKWYKLRADLDSLGNVKVYLDGSLKGSVKFKKAIAGWLGFGADRVESLFDNFYCEEATVFP